MLEHALEAAGIFRIERGGFALSWLNPGEIGVVAFFFVSGFVIPLSMEKWNNIPHFWINRFFRIYPLYIFVFLAGLVVQKGGGLTLGEFPANFAMHFLFIQEFFRTANFVPVAWTLSLEAVWYAGFTVAFILGLHRRVWAMVTLCILVSLVSCLFVLLSGVRLPMGRLSLLLVCVLGLFCFRRELGDIAKNEFLLACTVVGLVIAVNLDVGFHLLPSSAANAPSFRCVSISWTIGALVFLLPYTSSAIRGFRNAILTWTGKVSYSVYLVHALVIMALVSAPLTGGMLVIAIIILTMGISGLTFRFIEKPWVDYSHTLKSAKNVQG